MKNLEIMESGVEECALTQAQRVIAKFGGPRALARALKENGTPRDPATIYRWTYPSHTNGRGGIIPKNAWGDILAVARIQGVLLTAEDLDPRPTIVKKARTGRTVKVIPPGGKRDREVGDE
jgi:hypothetical protein